MQRSRKQQRRRTTKKKTKPSKDHKKIGGSKSITITRQPARSTGALPLAITASAATYTRYYPVRGRDGALGVRTCFLAGQLVRPINFTGTTHAQPSSSFPFFASTGTVIGTQSYGSMAITNNGLVSGGTATSSLPGIESASPLLDNLSKLYEQYRVRSASWRYVPYCATTTPGQYVVASVLAPADLNWVPTLPTVLTPACNSVNIANLAGARSFYVWQTCAGSFQVDSRLKVIDYIGQSPAPEAKLADLVDTIASRPLFGYFGARATSIPEGTGMFYVELDIEFHTFRPITSSTAVGRHVSASGSQTEVAPIPVRVVGGAYEPTESTEYSHWLGQSMEVSDSPITHTLDSLVTTTTFGPALRYRPHLAEEGPAVRAKPLRSGDPPAPAVRSVNENVSTKAEETTPCSSEPAAPAASTPPGQQAPHSVVASATCKGPTDFGDKDDSLYDYVKVPKRKS